MQFVIEQNTIQKLYFNDSDMIYISISDVEHEITQYRNFACNHVFNNKSFIERFIPKTLLRGKYFEVFSIIFIYLKQYLIIE